MIPLMFFLQTDPSDRVEPITEENPEGLSLSNAIGYALQFRYASTLGSLGINLLFTNKSLEEIQLFFCLSK